jgi:hypothetical protein
MSTDYQLFDGKSLSSLFKDIYDNQQTKKKRISELINDIRTKVKTPADMAMLYPIVNNLVETSVKNDDSLVKMAVVAQRLINSENKSEGDSGFLTDKEKQELLEIAKQQAEQASKTIDDDISDNQNKLNII